MISSIQSGTQSAEKQKLNTPRADRAKMTPEALEFRSPWNNAFHFNGKPNGRLSNAFKRSESGSASLIHEYLLIKVFQPVVPIQHFRGIGKD